MTVLLPLAALSDILTGMTLGWLVTPAERARLLGADGEPEHAETERIEREDVVSLAKPSLPVQRLASKRDQVAELLSAAPASPEQLREATGFADSTLRRLLPELETEARREGRGKRVHSECSAHRALNAHAQPIRAGKGER